MELEGTMLGHYQLQRRLARGGMSEVYLAYDQRTQRTVAIKVVNRYQDDHMQRIRREVKVLGMLSHPHILSPFDYGEHGPWYYFVMPYVEQGSLRHRLLNGPLTQEEAGTILEQVACALQCAHDHGILHRDIKPANILFAHKQHVYLTDFGLAREMDQRSDLTPTGCIIGTPEYMAPEIAEESASASSDIYALGILLYQMLTGRVPFKASSPLAVCWKHIQEQPIRPSLLNPTISQSIEQVILQALEKVPCHRFPTAQAMVQAYDQALQASRHTQTLSLTAPIIRLLKVDAQPGRFPRQLMPTSRSLHRRTMQLTGSILVTALLFLVIPLTLGFFLSGSGLQTQALTVSGASLVFTQTHNPPYNTPPHLQPTASTQAPANGSGMEYSSTQSKRQGSGHGSTQSKRQGSGQKHGHKHGHGHRHGH